MALEKCYRCGRFLEPGEDACPRCGAKRPSTAVRSITIVVTVFVVVAVLLFGACSYQVLTHGILGH